MTLFDLLNPYAYVMRLRRWLYRRGVLKSSHPGVPVISVGNLSMGGTGKSPMVVSIVRYLIKNKGKRVAIVSRGYRRTSKGFVLVRNGASILAGVEESGDEAQMFAELLPEAIIIVDEERVRGARKAKRLGAEIIVLDDGYQHLRIQRDLNILLVDASRSLSSVIPFGRFRESLSAARSADVVVFTHADEKEHLRAQWSMLKPYMQETASASAIRFVPSVLHSITDNQSLPIELLRGKRVLALCSIASPKRFIAMLEAAGAEVILRNLGDHAEYSAALVQTILSHASMSGVEMIVTTEKDAVKSGQYFSGLPSSIPIAILSQRIEFLSGERSFYGDIDRLL